MSDLIILLYAFRQYDVSMIWICLRRRGLDCSARPAGLKGLQFCIAIKALRSQFGILILNIGQLFFRTMAQAIYRYGQAWFFKENIMRYQPSLRGALGSAPGKQRPSQPISVFNIIAHKCIMDAGQEFQIKPV